MKPAIRRTILPLLIALPLLAQAPPDFSAIERSTREELGKINVPGAAVAILRGG